MSTDTTINLNHLTDLIVQMQNGVRDPEAAKKSLALLQEEREELRKQIGTVHAAVDLVRDARDQ